MRRLNLTFFMNLGASLDGLSRFETNVTTLKGFAGQARDNLQALFAYDMNPMSLPASYSESTKLIEMLTNLLQQEEDQVDNTWEIWLQASKVQTLLQGELGVQAVYLIWPKRAYDTNRLISAAGSIFSEAVGSWLTKDEQYDIEQAGKCLAFETSTGAGFHLFRAAESVIRRYYQVVVGTLPKPKMRNWGTYLKVLRECGASPKVTYAIEQIKELYRNPVMHPEERLSMDEAISLLGIVETFISTVYVDFNERQSAPVISQLASAMAEPRPS